MLRHALYLCRSRILDNGTEPYQDYGGEWHIQGTLAHHIVLLYSQL